MSDVTFKMYQEAKSLVDSWEKNILDIRQKRKTLKESYRSYKYNDRDYDFIWKTRIYIQKEEESLRQLIHKGETTDIQFIKDFIAGEKEKLKQDRLMYKKNVEYLKEKTKSV